jgi:hypothetical protein
MGLFLADALHGFLHALQIDSGIVQRLGDERSIDPTSFPVHNPSALLCNAGSLDVSLAYGPMDLFGLLQT